MNESLIRSFQKEASIALRLQLRELLLTLTDGLRTTPGAVVLAGPLGRANQTVSCLAAKTQQALGFKLFPSQPRAVGRHSGVSAHSWTDTYLKTRRRVNGIKPAAARHPLVTPVWQLTTRSR